MNKNMLMIACHSPYILAGNPKLDSVVTVKLAETMAHQLLSLSTHRHLLQQPNKNANKASRSKIGTNVNQKLLTECQALIAFACYDSPVIMQGGASMREATIESLMAKYCFGDPAVSEDSEILTYVDQFLFGLNKLKGLYETATTEVEQQDVLTMLPTLHCQSGLNIYVGEGSIEKDLLYRKSLTNLKQQISGRTLLRLAKEVLCNCKKMMALVTDTTSPYQNGTYPSGMTWDDYAKWCLSAFYNSECGTPKSNVNFEVHNNHQERYENETAVESVDETSMMRTTSSAPPVNKHSDILDSMTMELDTNLVPNADPSSSLSPAPAGYFFKGYLAWCLWGHIPVSQSESTSTLFTDAKVDASYGRKTGSRAALKRRADLTVTPNNARKRMPPIDATGGASTTSLCDSTITSITPSSSQKSGFDAKNVEGMMGILTKTLAFINGESLENELQKNALLKIKRVREKIHAANRKHDQLSNVLYRSENGSQSIRDLQFQRLLAYETEITELETKLDELLDAETSRRQKMLSDRTAACRDDEQKPQTIMGEHDDISPQPWSSASSSKGSDNPTTPITSFNGVVCAVGGDNSLLCEECNVIPTQRKCRKCKERYVCDVCCSTKRGLEMVWWCELCFGKETVASQALIRSGNYDSETDDDQDGDVHS